MATVTIGVGRDGDFELIKELARLPRPIELILQEIDIPSSDPGSARVTFDFDPVRGQVESDDYVKLIAAVAPC